MQHRKKKQYLCIAFQQKAEADMAQLVEQRIRNAWVPGSSPGIGSLFLMCDRVVCGNSSVGRALASQARGHGFEPRLPLLIACFFKKRFQL